MAGLLMESGAPFDRERLHRKKYFADLMKSLREVPESVKDLLRMSRGSMEMFESTQKQLIKRLPCDPALEQRLERLWSEWKVLEHQLDGLDDDLERISSTDAACQRLRVSQASGL